MILESIKTKPRCSRCKHPIDDIACRNQSEICTQCKVELSDIEDEPHWTNPRPKYWNGVEEIVYCPADAPFRRKRR